LCKRKWKIWKELEEVKKAMGSNGILQNQRHIRSCERLKAEQEQIGNRDDIV